MHDFRSVFFVLTTLLFFYSWFNAQAAETETGTLCVTYQTGPNGERLNRVRFFLINEQQEQQIYPKAKSFVEDNQNGPCRIVVLNNISTGTYLLKFLIPNTDGLFENIPEQEVVITKNRVTEVKQIISPVSLKQEIPAGDYQRIANGSLIAEAADETANILRGRKIITQPLVIYNLNGFLTVNTNLPQARWSLYQNNILVFSGTGPVFNLPIEGGSNYQVRAEEIEGYTVAVNPPFSFSLSSGGYTAVDINYQRTYGYLNIRTDFNNPDGFEIIVGVPGDPNPIQILLKPENGKINWRSAPLPTGLYEVGYRFPITHEALPPQLIRIQRGQQVLLRPRPVTAGLLSVTANIPEAIYLLSTSDHSQAKRGEGAKFLFRGLRAGTYILTFTSQNPDIFIAPDEMRFTMNDFENKEIKVVYQFAGKLILTTNVDKSTVNIRNLGDFGHSIKQDLIERRTALTLPEGRYRLIFESGTSKEGTMRPPDPIEVQVRPFRTEEVNVSFTPEESQKTPEKTGKLIISSNISEASFVVQKLSDRKKESIGHFTGKYVTVPLEPSQSYEVVFENVPNYKEPDVLTVKVEAGELKTIQVNYAPIQQIGFVPGGKAIIGDPNPDQTNVLSSKEVNISPFSIGIYEVTNAQYALWLNQAFKENKVFYTEEADNRGQVIDVKGLLIFKTFEADPYSQVTAQMHSETGPTFMAMAGKDSYPVISVSWYGAIAYCKDNKCRLPTEAEWEKAASMAPDYPGTPLKKFSFGFSRDTIDKTWANYNDGSRPAEYFQVLTTPVGFYNGVNLLSLSSESKGQEVTNLAKSPYGAFDMSGNVWEWVSDWYDSELIKNMSDTDPKGPETGTEKVVKGGCYDSLADGVRVAERMGLAPNHTDAFTGFRIAVD